MSASIRYKGYELVNVGLSWYVGPHDPRAGVFGRHVGSSLAAAKREINRWIAAAKDLASKAPS